jgi:hypothetical protein
MTCFLGRYSLGLHGVQRLMISCPDGPEHSLENIHREGYNPAIKAGADYYGIYVTLDLDGS